jgi:isoleucyl-tRNA synthetase
VVEYRRIRNTLRFLLANTVRLRPAHAVPVAELLEIDRYAVANMARLQKRGPGALRDCEFHPVVASCRTTARKTWAASTWTS